MKAPTNDKTASFVKRCVMASILVLTPIMANADVYYEILGKVFDIKDQSISVSDRYYLFSSTLKIHGTDGKKIRLDDLKKGDPIRMTIITLDKKRLVDRIERISESDLR